jgi:hypothetical protein
MKYRLKDNAPAFQAVDGPLAGRTFEHGRVYTEIPPGERKRFETVKPAGPAKPKGGGKGGAKSAAKETDK